MPHEVHIPYLTEFLTFLVTAVIVVPVSRVLRISPIIGFLVVGMAVGPTGLGIVTDVEGINALAELGVIFLLFTIGLELSLDRVYQMRRYVFGLGLMQVLVCGAAIGGLMLAAGVPGPASLLIGLSLALSSTAVVIQLLVERDQISSRHGRVSFAVLLFQDLAVVPLLFLVGAMSADSSASPMVDFGLAMLKATAAVIAILVIGRVVLRPVFRLIASTRSPEIFVALTLLALLGTSVATGTAGLSMALGAFLVGLLLAETEFRHQIEADILPFKGLLLGLFFISVGLRIDLSVLVQDWYWIILAAFGLYLLKSVITALLALAFKFPAWLSVRAGLLLGQGGEFAFVIIAAATASAVVDSTLAQLVLIVTALTMLATPFAALFGEKLSEKLRPQRDFTEITASPEELNELEDHVIIAGFGRVGRTVARLLSAQKTPFVALDLNAASLARYRAEELPVFFGDSRQRDVLERAGANRATTLVITLDDPEGAKQVLSTARQYWPDIDIYVRAKDAQHALDLQSIGACHAIPETVESSLQLGASVLESLGTPIEAVGPIIEGVRSEIYEGLVGGQQEKAK
ncbi:MAG: monovalent cation:proton antiporter-2 (CPA2) family protein [Alphaproteobacteria bacterium]